MRPLKLTMQAFGPYQERETVDFTELGPNRVFLIHGDTGAGKTTILDAMVFALYDDTSGGERRATQMRCESAPDTLPTEVTFDFSLGPKRLRIRRRPAQELTGARGATVTKPAEVSVWDRTGCADEQEGKLLTTKIIEANALVKEYLGFSCDQFRQVVVLPQGRFRELLSAGSDKREEILRQLFKTARFRQLEEALLERAKTVRKQMEALRIQREAQLGLVDAADEAELAALVEAAASEFDAADTKVAQTAAASLAAGEQLKAAEAADEARKALLAARAELERLQARKGEIDALKLRLEAAARAEKVQPASDRLVEARGQAVAAASSRFEAEQALVEARVAEQAATEGQIAEERRAPERDAADDALRHLRGLTAAIAAWAAAKSEFDTTHLRTVSARHIAEVAAFEQTRAEQALASLQQQLAAVNEAAAQVEGARVRLEAAEQHADRCRRLLSARDALEEAEERCARFMAAESDALEGLRQTESELQTLEDKWRAGRAVALAARLVPGQPCPVCGATDHPSPAQAGEEDVADEHLTAAKSAVEQARRAHADVHEATARARNDVTAEQTVERSIREEPGARTDLALADASGAVSVCTAELERLNTEADMGGLQAEIESAQTAAETARSAAQTASNALIVEDRAHTVSETRLNERASAVPEELRAAGALEQAIEEAERTKSSLDTALAEARKRLTEAKEKRIGLESAAGAAVETETKVAAYERSCVEVFDAALARHGFSSQDDWRGALLPEPDRLWLAAELEAHGNAVQQATGRLRQAELAAANQPDSVDCDALRAAAQGAASEHAAAIARHADARNAAERLAKVGQHLAEIDSRSEEVSRTYETVGVLADVANGGNSNKVSFQRWVLGVYLDEVLVAASRKLFAMSKRYYLQREREPASRGRASGLDLAVFDEFSGTTRPAVTLSGGESFLAALALALGLAETVQEHAAGIPLETIFVDEGFGALDSDSLELAIDALMELQQGGRLVGVISHVPELRQVIPARLEVRGGSGGSSTRFIVP
jgi:DNA repair protein SbcC/Rad50